MALLFFFGAWTLYAHLCLIGQASFATMRTWSFVVFFVAVPAWVFHRRSRTLASGESAGAVVDGNPSTDDGIRLWPAAAVALCSVVGKPLQIALGGSAWPFALSDWIFWLGAAAYLLVEFRRRSYSAGSPGTGDATTPYLEWAAIGALCVIAALVTAGTMRPTDDDAYFVSVAVAVKDFPAAVPQSIDAMHRTGWPPVEQMLHLPQTYEVFVGLLSSVSGISVSKLYYTLLPPLWAVLAVLATWAALRVMLPRRMALSGTAVFVFLQVFWGDWASFGDHGLVVLHLGKAVYLTVILPLVVVAAWRWCERPSAAAWTALMFSQFAAVGMTTNGVVLAPLAAALVILARPPRSAGFRRTSLLGVAASLPMLLAAAALFRMMAPYHGVVWADPLRIGPWFTLGAWTRAPLVLLAVLAIPALASRARLWHAEWMMRYVAITILVIFLPAVSLVAAYSIGHVFGWRLLWAVPIPLLVSAAGGIAAGSLGTRRWQWTGAFALWFALFAVAGVPAISRWTWNLDNIGRPKVYAPALRAAEMIMEVARRDAPVLAPEPVTWILTSFSGTPPLIAVREMYLYKLRGFVPDDSLARRAALLKYAQSTDRTRLWGPWPNFKWLNLGEALKAIDDLGIATFAFPEWHADARALVDSLSRRGFIVRTVPGYVVTSRPN